MDLQVETPIVGIHEAVLIQDEIMTIILHEEGLPAIHRLEIRRHGVICV